MFIATTQPELYSSPCHVILPELLSSDIIWYLYYINYWGCDGQKDPIDCLCHSIEFIWNFLWPCNTCWESAIINISLLIPSLTDDSLLGVLVHWSASGCPYPQQTRIEPTRPVAFAKFFVALQHGHHVLVFFHGFKFNKVTSHCATETRRWLPIVFSRTKVVTKLSNSSEIFCARF